MANHCAVTISLSDIERIQIYINSAKKSLSAIKNETGADYLLNGTLYNLTTGAVNCHLKVDGEVIAKPNYTVWGYEWDTGPDISMEILPSGAENYIACTKLILDGRKDARLIYEPGQGGVRGRSAIGIKGDRLALYCTKDGTSAARTPEKLRDDLFAAGWYSAVMLDGGGSSQCDFAGQTVTSTRKVQHLILVYLKKKCPYPEPTVNVGRGSVGDGVRWVQWNLNARINSELDVDGDFGPKTETALVGFQKYAFPNEPKEWDGICGKKTREKLR